jgi:hypothetical protein
MNQQELLDRLYKIKEDVKSQLKRNSIVVPVKTKNGIKLDEYEIVKEEGGFSIYDRYSETKYKNINYLQTAVLIANNLALNKPIKNYWIVDDLSSGSCDFDIQLYENRFKKSLKNNDIFGLNHYNSRLQETKIKKKQRFKSISSDYNQFLRNIKSQQKSNKYS